MRIIFHKILAENLLSFHFSLFFNTSVIVFFLFLYCFFFVHILLLFYFSKYEPQTLTNTRSIPQDNISFDSWRKKRRNVHLSRKLMTLWRFREIRDLQEAGKALRFLGIPTFLAYFPKKIHYVVSDETILDNGRYTIFFYLLL